MGASLCPSCGQLRAPRGDQKCSVCWLVAELKLEHEAGEHDERLNPSCIRCTRDNFSDEGFVLTQELRGKLGMTVRYCDCGIRLTSENRASSTGAMGFDDICIACYEYEGWVNTHSDNGHSSDNFDPECPVCIKVNDQVNPVKKKKKVKGPESHVDHQSCYDKGLHEKTPKGRAACRAGKFRN